MQFLANENFPYPSAHLLKKEGFSITTISETNPGISDKKVIELAKQNNSIILTFDKDYGEIIFHYGLPDPPAVVFFRYKGNDPEAAGDMLLELIKNDEVKLNDCFTVIDIDGIRQRNY